MQANQPSWPPMAHGADSVTGAFRVYVVSSLLDHHNKGGGAVALHVGPARPADLRGGEPLQAQSQNPFFGSVVSHVVQKCCRPQFCALVTYGTMKLLVDTYLFTDKYNLRTKSFGQNHSDKIENLIAALPIAFRAHCSVPFGQTGKSSVVVRLARVRNPCPGGNIDHGKACEALRSTAA
jgi:hypothetical protein